MSWVCSGSTSCDGYQVELPDNWLVNGNIWEIPRPNEAVEVHFGGYVEEYERGRPPEVPPERTSARVHGRALRHAGAGL